MVTMDELKAGLTATILFLVAALLTGCASIQSNIAQTREWQTKADAATAAFGVGQVTVILGPGTSGGYDRGSRQITLGTETPNKEWLLSHELGHAILGHSEGGDLEHEMAANAEAVRVLQVWGRSEEAAFRYVANILLTIQQWQKSTVTRNGHSWCLELADLQARYSQYQAKSPERLVAICPNMAGR